MTDRSRRASWLAWCDIVGLGAITAFGFAVARGPALAVPIATAALLVLQVVRVRSRRIEITDQAIVVSQWRSDDVFSLDRAHLRFVNLEDYGRYMSPVLEEVGADGRVVHRVTLHQLRFVDDPSMTPEQFTMQNRASTELYERIAAVVSRAEPVRRWMTRHPGPTAAP